MIFLYGLVVNDLIYWMANIVAPFGEDQADRKFRNSVGIVGRPGTPDRFQGHVQAKMSNGLQIGDCQQIIGLSQDTGCLLPRQGRHCALPGGGEADPGGKPLFQLPVIRLRAQAVRRLLQQLLAAALAAADNGVCDSRQHRNASSGKPLRRGDRPRERQFQYQIRPALQRHFRPCVGVKGGGTAPLGKMPAHGDDNGCAGKLLSCPLDQILMSPVKGIELRYNAHSMP